MLRDRAVFKMNKKESGNAMHRAYIVIRFFERIR